MSGIGCSSIQSPAGAMRASLWGRSGQIDAISAAIIPPIEWATRWGWSMPSSSTTSHPWSVKSSMSSSSSSPLDSPKPGSSGADTE